MNKSFESVEYTKVASKTSAAFVSVWLITVVVFLILSKLAWWQWQRADEKAALLQRIVQLQQHPLTLSALDSSDLSAVDGGRMSQQVMVLSPYSWLLDNQLLHGQPGYDVIVAVQSLNEAGPVLLVNLGWIPAPASRDRLPSIQLPATLQLDGLLRVQPGGILLGQNVEPSAHYPHRIQSIVPAELARLSELPLLDAVVYQQSSAYVYRYQPVTLAPERHRAYALQWALLAIAALAVAYFATRRVQPTGSAHD